MATMQHLILQCAYIGAPIQIQEAVDGSGIHAWVYSNQDSRIILLADGPQNRGVSATNGFGAYAEALRRELNRFSPGPSQWIWYELDSTGRFDEVSVTGCVAEFRPLHEPPHSPSSNEAFMARIERTLPDSYEYWQMALFQLGHLEELV
ncbi:ABC transporter substrate-binding protein [Novimethylophilus kurashikiensis]|uniref:ABC transporter substrate-binding protein n=1 Tax=Novimethylophilus kurashikiensis TaxID=1825523 RepID=A0A2R5FAB5_9PROT|nr:hypothetical protein [Novimethylophilus kurashikiensis]GBG14488.1 ABC transporter substrate-binding protein [Novimethylophilus kurashikiensis]